MNKLKNYFKKTPLYGNFLEKYHKNEELKITNTNDSVSLLFLVSLFEDINDNLLIVTPNLYNAQKVYDLLVSVMDSEYISFFPQDEFITTEMLAMSTEFKLERINTIRKILENKKSIIITNTTGYIKYLVPKVNWEKAILQYKVEDTIDINELARTLVSYGYKRESAVENQGDFSIKGGIIDVFPLNEDKPLRIDLFDDEIDSIRYFDVSTQRSTIKTKELTIYPMHEFF